MDWLLRRTNSEYNDSAASSSSLVHQNQIPTHNKSTTTRSDHLASPPSPNITSESPQASSIPSTYPHWHDIIAGAASGLGARAITAPLDLIKIRRQLQPSSDCSFEKSAHKRSSTISSFHSYIIGEWKMFHHLHSIAEREGGIRSLFRGNLAASYLWMGYSVVQFWIYGHASGYLRHYYNSVCDNRLGSRRMDGSECDFCNDVKVTGTISFISGAVSGICGTLVTYPLDLCRTIFAARGVFPIAASNVTWSQHTTALASESERQYIDRRPPKSLREFSRQLYQQKGFQGFFAGIRPAILSIIPYMGLNFALHDIFVIFSQDSILGNNESVKSGVAGMGAGVISKFLVYPLDTVKKRLQAQGFWGSSSGYNNETRVTNFKSVVPRAITASGDSRVPAVVYEGMIDCLSQVVKREGFAALYKGLLPSLLKSSISTGASFWMFTLVRNFLRSVHDSEL